MLHGLAAAHAVRIEQARGDRPFRSLEEFARRTGLGRPVLCRLAKAGAFASLEPDRREALWHALAEDQVDLPLFDRPLEREQGGGNSFDRTLEREQGGGNSLPPGEQGSNSSKSAQGVPRTGVLPKMSPAEEVLADYRSTGLSLQAHPLEFLRAELERIGVVPAERLGTWPDGKPVRVAGIVLVRQRPGTAKGITFVTLEDETGQANLIIRPGVWKRWRQAALGATLLLAHGRLQRQGQVIHVLCTKLEDLSGRLSTLMSRSRDFC